MDIKLLAALLIFASVITMMMWIYYYREWKKEKREVKLRLRGEYDDTPESSGTLGGNFFGALGIVGKKIGPKKGAELNRLRVRLARAGLRKESYPVLFYGLKAMFAGLGLLLSFPLNAVHFKLVPSFNEIFLGIIFAVAGFYLPDILLKFKIDSRKKQMTEHFPDALDLLVICMEAGMGLDAAMSRVGEEMRLAAPALSDEFQLLGLEFKAGKPRREALRNMAVRIDVEDIYGLVTLIIQTDKFGTGVAHALRVYSDTMRSKRQQRAEETASKLPVKLVFPLVFFIFPSLFIAILGPAAIHIFRVFSARQ